MADYHLTNLAVKDLADIWNYTFDYWSEEQADLYYGQLTESFRKISNNPKLGRNYKEIMVGLYGLKVNKHIIFYRTSTQGQVEITRIIHERMDIKNRLKGTST